MCAAAWGYVDIVKFLLSNGADKFLTGRLSATASDIAREKDESKVAEFIDGYPY